MKIDNLGGSAAIVFVHGVFGSSKATWGKFPEFLAEEPKMSFCDLAFFEFRTGILVEDKQISTIARLFKGELEQQLAEYDNIFILAHSLGGLITKQAVIYLVRDQSAESQRLLQKLQLVFMFAVPHQGSWLASLLAYVPIFFSHLFVHELRTNSSPVRMIRYSLRECINTRNETSAPFPSFKIVYGTRDWIVRDSALHAEEADYLLPVEGNHQEIVKPVRPSDAVVRLVVNQIARLASKALFSRYLRRALSIYADQTISRHYVDPAATSDRGVVDDQLISAASAALAEQRARVLVLGDYGSGKTSFSYELTRVYAERFLAGDDSSAPLPIYLNLSLAKDSFDVFGAFSKFVRRWGLEFPAEALQDLVHGEEHQNVIFVLDGLDEMARRVDWASVPRCIEAIDNLQTHRGVRCLITCRTTFFRDELEEGYVEATRKLTIKPFSTENIDEYLGRIDPDAAEITRSILEKKPELRELCTCPIYPFLVCEFADDEFADTGENVETITLYEAFVRKALAQPANIEEDWPLSDRHRFIRELAFDWFVTGRLECRISGLREALQEALPTADLDKINTQAMKIASCSLFMRIADNYRFVHMSFMEYFVAKHVVEALYSGNLGPVGERPFYAEIYEFIVALIKERGLEFLPKQEIFQCTSDIAQGNLLAALSRWHHHELRGWFKHFMRHGSSELARCVAIQGFGVYADLSSVGILLEVIEQEENSVIRGIAQGILERAIVNARNFTTASIQAVVEKRPVITREDSEAILRTDQIVNAYRHSLAIGDKVWASTIAAIYLLASIEDEKSVERIRTAVRESQIQEVQAAYQDMHQQFRLPALE